MKPDKETIDSYIFIGTIPIMLIAVIACVVPSWLFFIVGESFICGIISIIFYIREIWSQRD